MLDVVSRLQSGQRLDFQQESLLLDELESCECWKPLFRYLERFLRVPHSETISLFTRLIRVKLFYFNDISTAEALVGDLVRQNKMNFDEFREQVLTTKVVSEQVPQQEVALLEAAAAAFSKDTDRVKALERVAMIYEKRLFNDIRLQDVFERILKLDHKNVRALRYFKLAFTQNGDWEEVVKILKKLIQISVSEQEKFRLAHDLAHSLVYNLNQPRDALLVIDKYCKGSPLDISQVEYDSAFRLGDLDRCIRVLSHLDNSVRDDAGRAVINFRLALLYRSAGMLKDCENRLRQSCQYWPVFLDPFEHLIELYLEAKKWPQVVTILKELSGRIKDPELIEQINQTVNRIGLEKTHS